MLIRESQLKNAIKNALYRIKEDATNEEMVKKMAYEMLNSDITVEQFDDESFNVSATNDTIDKMAMAVGFQNSDECKNAIGIYPEEICVIVDGSYDYDLEFIDDQGDGYNDPHIPAHHEFNAVTFEPSNATISYIVSNTGEEREIPMNVEDINDNVIGKIEELLAKYGDEYAENYEELPPYDD